MYVQSFLLIDATSLELRGAIIIKRYVTSVWMQFFLQKVLLQNKILNMQKCHIKPPVFHILFLLFISKMKINYVFYFYRYFSLSSIYEIPNVLSHINMDFAKTKYLDDIFLQGHQSFLCYSEIIFLVCCLEVNVLLNHHNLIFLLLPLECIFM